MLDVYADFCAEDLAIPTIKGRKTDKEKFAGAIATYTIEALMHDGRALQSGTSHNFGDDFARAYGIQFTDKDNKLKYAFQTSWGLSTRIIGALIMVHGDNSGLVLPPKIAPTQVMIIPIQQRKAGVLEKAAQIKEMLKDFRVKVDETDKSPGFKFAEQEMRGIPLRIEIGPRDIAEGKCVVVRRDTREKISCDIEALPEKIAELLPMIQKDMYERAKKHLEEHTFEAPDKETFESLFEETKGFGSRKTTPSQAAASLTSRRSSATFASAAASLQPRWCTGAELIDPGCGLLPQSGRRLRRLQPMQNSKC